MASSCSWWMLRFQLDPGEKVGLVGPNGSGKATLFGMVVGEETPDEGAVDKTHRRPSFEADQSFVSFICFASSASSILTGRSLGKVQFLKRCGTTA